MEEAFTHFTLFTLFTPLCGLNLLNHISQLGPSCDGWFFPQPAAVHQGRWWSLLWRIGSAFDGFIMGTTTTNSLRPGRSSCKKMGTFESPSINTSTGSAQLAFLYIYITLASKFDQIAGYNPYPNISHQPGEMITAPEQLRDPSSKL